MKPEEIGKSYNQITHNWENKNFDRSNGIQQHEKAIAFTKKRGKALDVGCGCTGRLIDLLLSNDFTPEGIDVSSEMIALAQKKHPEISFHQKDICQWELTQKYDFITAWDSIWHVPLDQQEKVLMKLIDSLNKDGVLIFSCGGTEKKSEHKNNSMGPEMYYSTLGINGFLKLFIKLDCTCRHFEYDQYPELHMYFIIQK